MRQPLLLLFFPNQRQVSLLTLWLSISSGASGVNSGVINVQYAQNNESSPRVALVTISASGATGSPKTITITQATLSVAPTPSIPTAPSNISATALSSSRIALVWQDNANNESGFKIERKASGGMFSQINTSGAISGSGGYYEDTGLSGGTNYCYRARAYNSAGDSAYSNESCATTTATPSVQPVVNTGSATTITSNSATLNATVNPGGTATGAFFQWGNSSSFGNITPSQTMGNDNTNIDVLTNLTGLISATTYYFRIVAVNGAGGTVFGATQSFITSQVVTPSPADLAIENFTIDKQSANAGDKVKIQFIVRNRGGISSQPFSGRILLSSDSNLTNGKELFSNSISFPSINPNSYNDYFGDTYTTPSIPANTQTGTYYIGILTDNGLQKSLPIAVIGSVEVTPLPTPVYELTAKISANPSSVPSDSQVTISWTSTDATSCTVSPTGWTGTSGSKIETLIASKTYTLNCSGQGDSASDSITVNVDNSPILSNVTLTPQQEVDIGKNLKNDTIKYKGYKELNISQYKTAQAVWTKLINIADKIEKIQKGRTSSGWRDFGGWQLSKLRFILLKSGLDTLMRQHERMKGWQTILEFHIY